MSDPSDGDFRKDPWTGEEFEVVWGGGALLGPRDTRVTDPGWEPPKRLYNKKPKEEAKSVEINQEVSDEIDQAFVTVWSTGGEEDESN